MTSERSHRSEVGRDAIGDDVKDLPQVDATVRDEGRRAASGSSRVGESVQPASDICPVP